MAGEVFAWVFGAETALVLNDAMGWTMSSTSASLITPDNTYQHKAPAGLANYSLSMGNLRYAQTPPQFRPAAAAGSIQIAVRYSASGASGGNPWVLLATTGANHIGVKIESSGAVSLYINNTFKSTSAATFSWTSGFGIISLFYDMSANPWKGRLELNGVESNVEATHAGVAQASGSTISFRLYGATSGALDTHFGMVVIRDGYSTAAPHDRYATRIGVDADISTVGTWTSTEASNHAAISNDPVDPAKYTEEASPTAGDNLVCSYTSAMGTKLGFAPTTIDAVAVYSLSEGSGLGCAATIGDGSGSTTTGSTESIGASTTPAGVVATTKPGGGGAWSHTDTPQPGFKVVTT